jgi:hypothetical protein
MEHVKVGTARAAAAAWVRQHAGGPGFVGAYVTGSTVGLPDDAVLPPWTDLDIMVVADAPARPGKLLYDGVLLEVSQLPWAALRSAEHVLASYHLAAGLRTDTILADPTGRLNRLHAAVAAHFDEPHWVRRRCVDARRRVETGLRSIDPAAPWPVQVTGWLFPTGVTTHVLLVAARRNPTVRLRYVTARQVLIDHGFTDRYDELLSLLGVADLSATRVSDHLDALERVFDATAAVARTPYFFSADLTPVARPVAIDGSRELVRTGLHREAMFWIVATFARCHTVLGTDGSPEQREEFGPDFTAVLADLGIGQHKDLRERADAVLKYLPRLWETAGQLAPTS